MSRLFLTGLEPLLEKVGIAMPAAPPGLLSRAGGALAQGGRSLGQAASSGAAAAGRGMRGLGKAAIIPGLMLGGGLAYGALRQNDEDAQKMRQTYAPMTGSIYG